MSAFNIIKIIDLPLADTIDGSSLFAMYHNGKTVKVSEAMLLDLIESSINLADIPYDSTGNTKLTATNVLAVLAQIEQLIGTGSGASFDQDLNTTNDVEFVDINFTGDIYKDGQIWSPVANYYEKTFVAGEYLQKGQTCVLGADAKMYKTNALTETTSSGLVGMTKNTEILVNTPGQFIMWGELGGFVGLIPGSIFYLDTTYGNITTSQPANPAEIVRVIGYALNDTTMLFDPSKTWIERV